MVLSILLPLSDAAPAVVEYARRRGLYAEPDAGGGVCPGGRCTVSGV